MSRRIWRPKHWPLARKKMGVETRWKHRERHNGPLVVMSSADYSRLLCGAVETWHQMVFAFAPTGDEEVDEDRFGVL